MLFANGTATSWNAQTLVVLTASCICSTTERNLKNRISVKTCAARYKVKCLATACGFISQVQAARADNFMLESF
ncbi:hypothetical protein VNO78_15846 [Psophocarpus tetragonolobus]|uniref:Uncharacterized protein n=1 Tax=Psophocarpus tetragonolobus TaxID=3891 RepID=A0AAN9XJY9_PSOTE